MGLEIVLGEWQQVVLCRELVKGCTGMHAAHHCVGAAGWAAGCITPLRWEKRLEAG